MEQQNAQARFEGWAIVEMFGHQREAGFVTTQQFGTACLFQIDTPALPDREYELPRPEYVTRPDGSCFFAPAGTKVKRDGTQARSKLVGPGAIYALMPCSEDFAVCAIEELARRPLMLLALAPQRELTPAEIPAGEAPNSAYVTAIPDEALKPTPVGRKEEEEGLRD